MTQYPAGGFVYFLSDNESAIKIGITGGSGEYRAKMVMRDRGNYGFGKSLTVLAEMPGTEDDERRLHRRFAHLRLDGEREWFRDIPQIREFISWIPPLAKTSKRFDQNRCSFCGAAKERLVAGPSVFICKDCVELCTDMLR